MEELNDTEKVIVKVTDAIAYGIRRREEHLSNEEVELMLDQIKASFAGATQDPRLQLEIARAVECHRLKILSCRDEKFDKVDALYENLKAIGFSHLLDEGTVGIYFAQYCARSGRVDLARTVLRGLVRLAQCDSTSEAVICEELERDARRGLDSLPD